MLKRNLPEDILMLLPSLLEECGFEDAKVEFGRSITIGIGEDGIEALRVSLNGLLRMKHGIQVAGIIQSEEEYDSLISSLQEEWDQGLGADINPGCVIYAKKRSLL